VSLWFKKRRVRIHFNPGADQVDFEGILAGRIDGHYLLLTPKLLQEGGQGYTLDNAIEIPCERVLFLERLASA
jgi:hypothetical protein